MYKPLCSLLQLYFQWRLLFLQMIDLRNETINIQHGQIYILHLPRLHFKHAILKMLLVSSETEHCMNNKNVSCCCFVSFTGELKLQNQKILPPIGSVVHKHSPSTQVLSHRQHPSSLKYRSKHCCVSNGQSHVISFSLLARQNGGSWNQRCS